MKSLLITLTLACTFFQSKGQADPYRFSVSVSDHVLMAEPCRLSSSKTMTDIAAGEKYFMLGNFNLARKSWISAIRDIEQQVNPPQNKAIIKVDRQGLAAVQDRRPAIVKLTEKISIGALNEERLIDLTRCLNNLGIYYHSVGLLNIADVLFTKTLGYQGQALGKTSRNYVCTLHNLGNLRKDQGRYNDAEQIFDYVLSYYEKIEGMNSCEYATCLSNKAMLDVIVGRRTAAMSAYDKLQSMPLNDIFLPSSYQTQRFALNQALLKRSDGDNNIALQSLMAIKTHYDTTKHRRHPDYYDVVFEIGLTKNADSGSKGISIELLEEVLKSIGNDYGTRSAYYARVLKLKAQSQMNSDHIEEAQLSFEQIADIYKESFHDRHPSYLNALVDLSKIQWHYGRVEAASNNLQQAMSAYLYIIQREFPSMTEREQRQFWLVLKPNIDLFQGFALAQRLKYPGLMETAFNMEINTKGLILSNTKRIREEILSGNDGELKRKFQEWMRMKENLSYYYAIGDEALKTEEVDVAEYENSVSKLEKELYLQSAALSKTFNPERVDWKQLQNRLKPNEALVEIIRTASLDANLRDDNYTALLVKSTGPLLVIPLGKASYLEGEAYQNYRISIRRRKANEQSFHDYWSAVSAQLLGLNQVYLSRDGVYNTVNISGLKTGEGSFVIDLLNITLISNTKAFTSMAKHNRESSGTVYLFGNPDYSSNYDLSDLPGTEKEVLAIHSLLDSAEVKNQVHLLAEAAEERVKSLKDVAVLHIASHGFFKPAPRTGSRSLELSNTLTGGQADPMLRSGLLLAGAGTISEEAIAKGREDGILSAYEVMNLDLQNTKMVILSACESGLGDIVDGEGVYGLTRAFNVAGAELVLASLWEVDDYTTYKLMTETYREYSKTKDMKLAFLNAQRKIKEGAHDPSYWGAFVMIEN